MKNIFQIISGEPGVFIGKINPKIPSRAFLGYVDEKESQKKIVHDVFSKGDSAFISGNVYFMCICSFTNHHHILN